MVCCTPIVFLHITGSKVCRFCSVFERGLQFVGTDYAAYGLWSKYINYTAGNGGPKAAALIYRRALGQPLKELDKCFNRCGLLL